MNPHQAPKALQEVVRASLGVLGTLKLKKIQQGPTEGHFFPTHHTRVSRDRGDGNCRVFVFFVGPEPEPEPVDGDGRFFDAVRRAARAALST